MKQVEKVKTVALSLKWLSDLYIILSLICLLSIPLALAQEEQLKVNSKDREQPVIPVTAVMEPGKAMAQTLDSYTAGDSVDFLMGT